MSKVCERSYLEDEYIIKSKMNEIKRNRSRSNVKTERPTMILKISN
jgi:hypothetical protein